LNGLVIPTQLREIPSMPLHASLLARGVLAIVIGIVLFIRPEIGAESLAVAFGLYSVAFGISALVLSTETDALRRSDGAL
jgi:uncharacterized membrane protein HdeD (DUF308 family)